MKIEARKNMLDLFWRSTRKNKESSMTKCPSCNSDLHFNDYKNVSQKGLFKEFDCPKCDVRMTDRKLKIGLYRFLLMINIMVILFLVGVKGIIKEDIIGISPNHLILGVGAIVLLFTLKARKSLRSNTHFHELKN